MSEIKIGDRVIVTQRYSENRALVGDIGIIDKLDLDDDKAKYRIRYEYAPNRFTTSWCVGVRLLPSEPWYGNILKFRFV